MIKASATVGKSVTFPQLMVSNSGEIVLFTAEGSGTLVGYHATTRAERHGLGYHSVRWDMCTFQEYLGSVTLENEYD